MIGEEGVGSAKGAGAEEAGEVVECSGCCESRESDYDYDHDYDKEEFEFSSEREYIHGGEMMKRYCMAIGLKEENIPQYRELHAAVWPSVLKTITECNIRNYSIFLRQLPDGKYYLIAYLEYHGTDWDADMAKMAADPETQRWWKINKPLQEPLANLAPGEDWWGMLEEVFHTD